KPDPLDENLVRACADFYFSLERVRLTALVKGHDDHSRAVAADQLGLSDKFLLAFFEADRVDDSLPLQTLEAGFDDLPLRAVDHHRPARYVRFAGDEPEKFLHRAFRIEHSFIHIDIDDLRATFHLLARHAHCFFKVAGKNELGEDRRTGDIGSFADVDEIGLGSHGETFEATQAQVRIEFW